jgi:hypothetical protein
MKLTMVAQAVRLMIWATREAHREMRENAA